MFNALCTKFTPLFATTNSKNSNIRCRPFAPTRNFCQRWSWKSVRDSNFMTMSSVRFVNLLKDLMVSGYLGGCSRSFIAAALARRCRKDRGMREVGSRCRQTLLRPRYTLLFTTVSATYKNNEEKSGPPDHCSKDISDDEMQALISDLEGMDELSKATLFCVGCAQRVVIDNKQPGVRYCKCDNASPPVKSYDGWEPYMEAEDIIIWRKEYKPGGLFAYKVYGRYKHITAEDFAATQVDGAYRKIWDTAVASIAVVEKTANGKDGQDVLHWEVLWPRLFANRDYVYIRRHKQYSIKGPCMAHKDAIFPEDEAPCGPITGAISAVQVSADNKCRPKVQPEVQTGSPDVKPNVPCNIPPKVSPCPPTNVPSEVPQKVQLEVPPKVQPVVPPKVQPVVPEVPNVHSNAKRAAIEDERKERFRDEIENRVYVIVSRSCKHPQVPESRKTIRVSEYWSHMVIKTLNGPGQKGMEFVLTYYDEPAVGGLPTAVMSWAMGRAGPAFLARMRKAAEDYQTWKANNKSDEDEPFMPQVKDVSYDSKPPPRCEEDMESSKEGPEMNTNELTSIPKMTPIAAESMTKVEDAVTKMETAVSKVESAVSKVESAISKVESAVSKVGSVVAKVDNVFLVDKPVSMAETDIVENSKSQSMDGEYPNAVVQEVTREGKIILIIKSKESLDNSEKDGDIAVSNEDVKHNIISKQAVNMIDTINQPYQTEYTEKTESNVKATPLSEDKDGAMEPPKEQSETETPADDAARWWRYFYPSYYFA